FPAPGKPLAVLVSAADAFIGIARELTCLHVNNGGRRPIAAGQAQHHHAILCRAQSHEPDADIPAHSDFAALCACIPRDAGTHPRHRSWRARPGSSAVCPAHRTIGPPRRMLPAIPEHNAGSAA
ncbi:hypothetical protein EC988_009500, partial [Linderina pennispora]